ncbi:MAG: L-threonylcarbamoyladenylate synthase [Clostridiaceae bacterium]
MKADLNGVGEASYNKAIESAGEIIKTGGIVAFPTETVYGLGADALNGDAVKLIFKAKGRPADNPLIIHVCDKNISTLTSEIPNIALKLMDEFWPGPLTIIMKKSSVIPYETTAGLETVGIRMPDNKCAQDLIKAGGGFIAAPSANISGRPSPTTFERCVADLDGRVEMIIGKDSEMVGLESTIIDVTGVIPEVLRPGAVTLEMLSKVIGDVAFNGVRMNPEDKPKAPGMKYTHYSPKAEVTIVVGKKSKITSYLIDLAEKDPKSMIILVNGEVLKKIESGDNLIIFNNIEEASKAIFETLRSADDKGFNKVFISAVPETGLGLAFMNRVKKSAGYRFLEVE